MKGRVLDSTDARNDQIIIITKHGNNQKNHKIRQARKISKSIKVIRHTKNGTINKKTLKTKKIKRCGGAAVVMRWRYGGAAVALRWRRGGVRRRPLLRKKM